MQYKSTSQPDLLSQVVLSSANRALGSCFHSRTVENNLSKMNEWEHSKIGGRHLANAFYWWYACWDAYKSAHNVQALLEDYTSHTKARKKYTHPLPSLCAVESTNDEIKSQKHTHEIIIKHIICLHRRPYFLVRQNLTQRTISFLLNCWTESWTRWNTEE